MIVDDFSRIHPELVEALQQFVEVVGGNPNVNDIRSIRAVQEQLAEAAMQALPPDSEIEVEDRVIEGPTDNPELSIRWYQYLGSDSPSPAMLWIHGGGMVLGSARQDETMLRHIAKQAGCHIASVEYRLAPEHPYPAHMDDCYAASRWLFDHATDLNINPDEISVAGASAGGGLAAGLCLLRRDRGDPPFQQQLLIFPMLDDRNVHPVDEDHPDTWIWSRESNLFGWSAYLGDHDPVPIYAAPSRAESLSGLPPAYIVVGDVDLFADENLRYAQQLIRDAVATELHVLPGAFHGFPNIAPEAPMSQACVQRIVERLRQGRG